MTIKTDDSTSKATVWGISALAGVVVAAVAIVALGFGWMGGLFLGVVVAVLLAVVLTIAFGGGHAAVPAPAADTAARATAPDLAPGPAPHPATAPEPTAAPAVPSASEPTGEEQRPATLPAPRGGSVDDLKKIKGIGPKLEEMLHGMGIYHFDQIAAWTPDELSWVDDNLTGFKGRASRDDWPAQAKLLAEGGETEFSARVGKGDVY